MEKVKDVLGIMKEIIVILVILGLVIFPSLVNERLIAAGFIKGTIGGFEWQAKQIEKSQQDVRKAGQAVNQAQEKLEEVMTSLNDLQKTTMSPVNTDKIRTLKTEVNESRLSISKVDENLKRTLITQETIINSTTETTPNTIGWIFLGRVVKDKKKWANGGPQPINDIDPKNLQDATLSLTHNVYLRQNTNHNIKTSAPILTVVKIGEQVKVLDTHFSSAKAGGYFVWVKVDRLDL